MASNYKFPIRDSGGSIPTTTENYFVSDGNTSPSSGALFGWGSNDYGQLGLNDRISKLSPTLLGTLTNWKQVSCGESYVSAIKTDGTLWAWGVNNWGNIGNGTNTNSYSSPVQIGALTNWSQVSASHGYTTAAIKTDGTLWSWGYNLQGSVGDGTTVHRSSPVQIGALTNWSKVTCGVNITLAIKTDGTLWSWGQNASYGALGLGDLTSRSSPVQVGSLTNWSQIAVNNLNCYAIKTDGTLWSWGNNSNGRLGLNDTTHRSSPTQVGSLTNWKQVAANQESAVAIKTDGTMWAWGHNSLWGPLGVGDLTHRSSPVQIGALTNWKQVACGYATSLALKTDGTLWSWGYNAYGGLGLGDKVHRSSPVQITSNITSWILPEKIGSIYDSDVVIASGNVGSRQVPATLADMEDMFVDKRQFGNPTLYLSGRNDRGQLGQNDRTHRSSPVQVGSLTNWKLVSAGTYFVSAIKNDGTLWSWGGNAYGHLGLGDTTHRSSPVQVGSLTNWKLLSCGAYHSMAIKTDGSLWTWGAGVYGELGQNNNLKYSSPVQIGSLTDWKQINASQFYSLAIKNDGTLWAWGDNTRGQLGQNNVTRYSSPVQIGALTNWKFINSGFYHPTAIKTDGTLWAWGGNDYGQLGLGDTNHRSSPVQVGSLTDWKYVAGGWRHTLAIKNDGTLWTWGYNLYGCLAYGVSTAAIYSSPIQVGTLTNWKQVSGGYATSSAIKTDGTLWTWGYNYLGSLGLSDTTNYSSPVQVGSMTNWKNTELIHFYGLTALQYPNYD